MNEAKADLLVGKLSDLIYNRARMTRSDAESHD